MSRWFRSESSGRVTLHFTLSYYIYLHRGQATSSLNIPARGWASFSIGFLVAAFDLATGACWLYLCAALGARVRLSATDLSVADAKLFATVASDVDRAILGCAFYAGLAIGALVFHPGGCFRRMWLPAVLRYVTSVLVLRRLWNAWHFLHCVGAGAIAACFAAMWGVLAFAAVCALLLRRWAGTVSCVMSVPFPCQSQFVARFDLGCLFSGAAVVGGERGPCFRPPLGPLAKSRDGVSSFYVSGGVPAPLRRCMSVSLRGSIRRRPGFRFDRTDDGGTR